MGPLDIAPKSSPKKRPNGALSIAWESREICTQDRPVSETMILGAPFTPGPFGLLLK